MSHYIELIKIDDFETWSEVNENSLTTLFAETGADREMDFDREIEERKIFERQ